MSRRSFLNLLSSLGLGGAAAAGEAAPVAARADRVELSDAEWKKRLADGAYRVLRHESTEPPHSSALNKEKRAGSYHCAGCDLALFASSAKYDSGTGWPSFWQPLDNAIGTKQESGFLFMAQTEVHCRRCGGHLGHVFKDGPKPTGLRYCMNGVAMIFKPTGTGA